MEEQIMYLRPAYFAEKERVLLEKGELCISLFRYDSGVCAVRVRNKAGNFIVLPYQGQQIWRMEFLGHPLTMRSQFEEPCITTDFRSNYGMFLLHCGLTAMGNPAPGDSHPQHGELPFAPFQNAFLLSGSDAGGEYVAVGGMYEHARCFRVHYTFQPVYKLYAGASTIRIEVSFTNLRDDPLEYFYMCHINHRPVDGARLVCSAEDGLVRHHYAPPARLSTEKRAAYDAFFKRISQDPGLQNRVDRKTQMYEPEICSTVTYRHDERKQAHTLQILPDGYACYVRHDPTLLPIGLRWIARTCAEDAMGMVLPATAEHLGYLYCKEHHFERYLAPHETMRYEIETGLLAPPAVRAVEEKIARIMAGS
ncbi:MAG: DUF4432 family protein [Clostridia bacterium]|nr:DUF4432 family protein [Clostridia bacterium]